jgi:transcriptional regulator with XRE-family HTH domain
MPYAAASTHGRLLDRLNQRRRSLGISCAVLARRTGVSLRTIQRILSGEELNPGFSTVASLAHELGIGLRFDDEVDVHKIRRRQAEQKARRLLALVQGNAALEAQAVSSRTMNDLRKQTINELLAGPPRKLWAD